MSRFNVFRVFTPEIIKGSVLKGNGENLWKYKIQLQNKWIKNIFVDKDTGKAVYEADAVFLEINPDTCMYNLIINSRTEIDLNLTAIEKAWIYEAMLSRVLQ